MSKQRLEIKNSMLLQIVGYITNALCMSQFVEKKFIFQIVRQRFADYEFTDEDLENILKIMEENTIITGI